MKKDKGHQQPFAAVLTEGQKHIIEDREHKSRAFVPLKIDAGN